MSGLVSHSMVGHCKASRRWNAHPKHLTVAMVALAGGAILYDTSNLLHHFSEDRYVGAALELFASVALRSWYVLRLFMSRD